MREKKMFTVVDLMKVNGWLKPYAIVPVNNESVQLLVEAVKYYKENSFHSQIPNYFGAKK